MKTDLYTKGILTVIALLLGAIIYSQIELIEIQDEAYSKLYSIDYFVKSTGDKLDEVIEHLDDIESNTY